LWLGQKDDLRHLFYRGGLNITIQEKLQIHAFTRRAKIRLNFSGFTGQIIMTQKENPKLKNWLNCQTRYQTCI